MNLPTLKPSPHRFSEAEFGSTSELLAALGSGKNGVAVMFTCSELGCIPDQVSHSRPGEIMISQNGGGLALKEDIDSLTHTILNPEFFPNVRHLIVCGHTQCRIIGLLLTAEAEGITNPFEKLMLDVDERFKATYLSRPVEQWLELLIQETVLQQLANLRSNPYIKSRLQEGSLWLHGWIREDDAAKIKIYDPISGQFAA